jgi:hypothetical protein
MIPKRQLLKIPKQLSEELAEEVGIHIGDGSMNLYVSKGKRHWGYIFSSHLKDDKEYRKYVKTLMKKLYNITPYERSRENGSMIGYYRKELVLFKKILGLPMGKKDNIKIPQWVMKNESFCKSCVRGIMDTDGCITFRKPFKKNKRSYPTLKITNKSKLLIEQLNEIFLQFGLKPSIYKEKGKRRNKIHIRYNVNLNGVKNLDKYLKLFGFSNLKHIKKYDVWKYLGYYPASLIKKNMAVTRFELVTPTLPS